MRFKEGDQVRNTRFEMGRGVITRHGNGPRSIRWAGHDGECWWVFWPEFRDQRWVDPDERGNSTWVDDSVLVADDHPEITRVLYADAEEERQQSYEAWKAETHDPDYVAFRWMPEPHARPADDKTAAAMAEWGEVQMTPQEAYDRLKLYQDNGMFSYVLPSSPVGEEFVLGLEGNPVAKFRGTEIITFIAGIETAIRHIAKQRGIL